MKYCFDLDGTICDTPLRKEDLKPVTLNQHHTHLWLSKSINYMMKEIILL